MKNIFALTKGEQRVVIVVLMVLVAAMLTKHYLDNRSQPLPTRSTSTLPTEAPTASPSEDEQTLGDDRAP